MKESRPPLRVAVVIDRFVQPRWIDTVLTEVAESGIATFALVVLTSADLENESEGTHPWLRRIRRAHDNRRGLAFSVYANLDAWRYRSAGDPFCLTDISRR